MQDSNTKKLILGSNSPRRKEILSFFSLPFKQIASSFDEDSVLFNGDPAQYVKEISEGKVKDLSKTYPDALILTADTTVYHEGKIYGKPLDSDEAYKFLSELQGAWHSVFTGVSLYSKSTPIVSLHEETRVLFNSLKPDEIRHYHKKLHWSDKAGGYAIQMAGGLAIKKIDGCYYNAMGLPINTVRQILLTAGIDLWNFIK